MLCCRPCSIATRARAKAAAHRICRCCSGRRDPVSAGHRGGVSHTRAAAGGQSAACRRPVEQGICRRSHQSGCAAAVGVAPSELLLLNPAVPLANTIWTGAHMQKGNQDIEETQGFLENISFSLSILLHSEEHACSVCLFWLTEADPAHHSPLSEGLCTGLC